jgi:phage regulator Rha-like protein
MVCVWLIENVWNNSNELQNFFRTNYEKERNYQNYSEVIQNVLEYHRKGSSVTKI